MNIVHKVIFIYYVDAKMVIFIKSLDGHTGNIFMDEIP